MSKYHPHWVPIEKGTVFGKWVVKEHAYGNSYWCECACGKRLKIAACTLRDGSRHACNRCTHGLADGEASFNEVYGNYRRNSRKTGREFALTKDQARQLFLSNCYYCGLEPSSIMQKRRVWSPFVYNGIDRIDNQVGYVMSNCLPCCAICNHMKHVLSYEDFLRHVNRIAEYRG